MPAMPSSTPASATRLGAGPRDGGHGPHGRSDDTGTGSGGDRTRAQRPAVARGTRAVLRFVRGKPLGAPLVIAMLLMAAFAERIAPYGYDESIRGARMRPPGAAHWLGTDNLSRDMWSRVVYGARVSVTVGFLTIALGTLAATAIGVSCGYFGGTYDIVVQRVVDAWMSFPYLIIVLSVMAVLGPGLINVVLSLSVIGAAINSRVIRGATLSIMQNAYV